MSKIINCPLIVLFLGYINVFSQISIGAKLGASSNKTTNDTRNIEFSEAKSTLDFHGGLVANFGLNNFLEIRAECNYSVKGFSVIKYLNEQSFTNKTEHNSSNWGTSYSYLQVPVLLHFKFVDSEKIKFYAGGGPYLSYALFAKKWANLSVANLGSQDYVYKKLSEKYEFDIDSKNDNRTDNRLDFGLIANIGLAFKFNKSEFFIESRYEHGITDVHSFVGEIPKTYSSMLHRSYTFTAGFMFLIKQKSYDNAVDAE